MIDQALANSIHQRLFADGRLNVFAVLDGASIPELLDRLYGERPEFFCLYRGELEPDMAEVAPYLVHLKGDSQFTRWVIEQGWGRHWAIFAVSPADLRQMRRHFRGLVMVYGPDDEPLYFRFYDPRVLRVYLPTCTGEEQAEVFGPVLSYAMEAEQDDVLLRFRPGEGRVLTEQADLSADSPAQEASPAPGGKGSGHA